MASVQKMKEKKIEIPGLEVRFIKLILKGQTPLIMHQFGQKAMTQIRDKQAQKAKEKKGARDPIAEFKGATYITKDGGFAFPSVGFKASACTAAIDMDDASKSKSRRAFHVLGEYSRIITDEPIMREDTVRLSGPSRAGDLRYRPEFKNWEAELIVQLKYKIISVEQMIQMFNEGGFGVGIGEWRPEKGGQFGKYKVVSAQYISEEEAEKSWKSVEVIPNEKPKDEPVVLAKAKKGEK